MTSFRSFSLLLMACLCCVTAAQATTTVFCASPLGSSWAQNGSCTIPESSSFLNLGDLRFQANDQYFVLGNQVVMTSFAQTSGIPSLSDAPFPQSGTATWRQALYIPAPLIGTDTVQIRYSTIGTPTAVNLSVGSWSDTEACDPGTGCTFGSPLTNPAQQTLTISAGDAPIVMSDSGTFSWTLTSGVSGLGQEFWMEGADTQLIVSRFHADGRPDPFIKPLEEAFIPEPMSAVLAGVGLVGITIFRKRKASQVV